jgi:chorismate synthase
MAEAMVAIVLADHWLRWKGQGRTGQKVEKLKS